jgi:transposase
MSAYLRAAGADISKKSVDIELYEEQKKHGPRLKVPNTQQGFEAFEAWRVQRGDEPLHVCLEATGTYSDAFALFLFEHAHQVSVLNPARVAAFRKSEGICTKTDAHDAMVLARFCSQKRPVLWHPTPQDIQQLQVLMGRLDDLEQMRQQERNRLENLRLDACIREQIQQVICLLQEQIQAIKERAHLLLKAHEELDELCGHLASIPGIAELTATRLLSVYSDAERFCNAATLVSYAGLCPAEVSSGTSVHGCGSIAMAGNAQVRHWLYMCALTAMRWNADFRQWSLELKARGKCNKVIIVAVMRKFLHLVHGVMKSGSDYDPRKAFPSHSLPHASAPRAQVAA